LAERSRSCVSALLRVVTIWGTLLLAFPSVSASLILKEPHERYVSFLKGTDRARHGCRVGNRCRDHRGIARAGGGICVNYDTNREGAEETAAVIREAAGDVVLLEADVCSEAAVEAMFAEAKRAFGTPTILVNSAGIDALGKPIAEMSLAEWEAALRTNLTGPFLCARAFVRGLAQANAAGGKIVNIGSVHEEIPRAAASEYCASKGGLRNLTRCLSLELAPQKINVNGIAPGMILTPMNQADLDDPEKLKKDEETIPLRRGGQPEEVARLALYLASSDADYVTGASYVIDGGPMQNQGQGVVKRTLAGIRREKGTAQNQKSALLVDDLRRMVAPLGASLLDRRDRALILLGFAAALRRSELVALRVTDVRMEEEGLVLTLRRSKTNQEGRLEKIAVAYGSEPTTCPVRALRAWLAAAGLVDGPIFVGLTPQGGLRDAPLGDRMVAHVVKRRCKAVGIDPELVAGHSLRRGFETRPPGRRNPIG